MAIYKKAIFSHRCSVKALNKPTGKGWDIFDLPNQIKTASATIEAEDLGGFDLKQATKDHPDHLYVKIFAIKKDEPNDNGDAFNSSELKKAAPTFVGVPLFTNHQNDDVEKARGECVHSWYDSDEGGIFIIGRVDKIAYPRLARGIEEGYITGTSMGCSVEYSVCSVCHNKANTSEDYCSHVKNRKNRTYTGDMKCAYHDSPVNTDEKCPICGSTKDDVKTLKHAEQKIYEHNYGMKFIENSFVVNPACHDCGVRCVLHAPTVTKKVASLISTLDKLIKTSASDADFFEANAENLTKLGGVKELEALKDSMSEMEMVVKSMLQQKENVSMEYVSDLVKAMADVQGIYDELMEMGYGALPSPAVTAEVGAEPMETFPQPQPMQPTPPPAPKGVQTSDIGDVGSVTLPKNSSKNKEEFFKKSQNLINKVSSLEQSLRDLINNGKLQLEMGAKMATDSKNTKTAAGPDNLEVITEKQLMKQEETLHPRTETVYEGITESKEQIGGGEKSNDTTSDSPQVRKGTYDTITEDQLKSESALGDAVIHFVEYPDVITEKQWNDFSRDVAGDLPDDYTEQITQAQLRELLSKHKFIGDRETITEDQLRNISMTDGLKRWAYKDYSLSLIKSATRVVADMISSYRKSPDEIRKAMVRVNDSDKMRSKVAFLSIVNSIPQREESRKAIASKARYFQKTASKDPVSTIDALILACAEHGQFAQSAEDLLEFVSKVVNDKKAMERVESMITAEETPEKEVSREDAFASAMNEFTKEADGKYQIKTTIEELGVDVTNKVAFFEGIKKYAQEAIGNPAVAGAVIKIEVTEDGGLIIDVQDTNVEEADEITPDDIGEAIEGPVEDIDADINGDEEHEEAEGFGEEMEEHDCSYSSSKKDTKVASAEKEIKKAQMMGGEMGGQPGAGGMPGGMGSTLPPAPAAGAPPMESFTDEPGAEDDMGGAEAAEPLPPGSLCPVCGSEDVDVIGGKGQCQNCTSEFTYKVDVQVTKWQGVTPSEEEGGPAEEGFEGEGFEMPTEEEAGVGGGMGEGFGSEEMPAVAAYTKLKPAALKKLAESEIELGSVSPLTGTTDTIKIAKNEYRCLDTAARYKVAYVVDNKDPEHPVTYAQWTWKPKKAGIACPTCDRAKTRFVKALSSIDMKQADFNALSVKDQVATIVKLKKAGALKAIKVASKNGNVTEDLKKAYGEWGDSFPLESCIEKLARRYGEDAICLSGPDEGKPLAVSICNRLKKADVYTNGLAVKVAEVWVDCDGDEDCVTHQVRSGFNLREAASICDTLKTIYAQVEDAFTDELGAVDNTLEQVNEDPMVPEDNDLDPFDGGGFEEEHGGTITIELPTEVAEQIEQAIEVAEGEGAEGIEEEQAEGEDVGGFGGEAPIEEEIAPEELEGEKPMQAPMKPCTGFEGDQGMDDGLVEKNKGIPQQPQKVEVTVNGQPLGGVAEQEGLTVKEAMNMHGGIGKVGRAEMDLSGVLAVLNKQAGEKEISQEKAQDSGDIGSYTAGEGGSQMGHENETIPSAIKPSVPRNNATMGQEPPELNPQDKPQPVIPSDNATMGHEDEVGLSGGDARYTGGDKGQGKTDLAGADPELLHMKGYGSTKDSLARLAERLATKLAPKAPVSKDKDVQPISGNSTIGKEEKFTADDPTNTEGSATESLMGHEGETLDKAPKSPADHPDVFTGNAQQGKEELDSEKTTKDKGTVIASGDSESEAIRVAGRMLQTKRIEATDLARKIAELKQYKPEQIRDIEKAIFAQKGLDSVSDGLSQPVQINETSSVRNAKDDLSKQLQSMFTLGKQNKWASEDENVQLRQAFRM